MNDAESSHPEAQTGDGAERPSLRRSAIRSGLWTTGGFAFSQVLRLGGNIILAALLFEEAFALMAIILALMQGLLMFSDFGLEPSIIKSSRGDDPRFLDTAWSLQVVRGVLIAIVTAGLAWPLAQFYSSNDPIAAELKYLLPLAALGPLLAGLQSVNLMRSQRHMQLERYIGIEVLAQVAGLAVMVFGAWRYQSVYALVIGNIVTTATKTALSHVAIPGTRPVFRFERSAAAEIIHFGKWVFLSTMISFLAMQLDKFAFGKMFPFDSVGVYGIAAGLAMLTPTLMGRIQGMVAFPLYSRILDDKRELGPLVERSKYPMYVLGGFIVAAMIASSTAFVELAYDERYAAAGIFIPILSAGAWFAVVHGLHGSILMALGRVSAVAATNAIKVLTFCALLLPAARFGGITGAVAAVAASDLVRAVAALIYARRAGLKGQGLDILFSLQTIGVGLAVLAATELTPAAKTLHPLFRIPLQIALVSLAFLPWLPKARRDLMQKKRA